jgi:hypothetical protein
MTDHRSPFTVNYSLPRRGAAARGNQPPPEPLHGPVALPYERIKFLDGRMVLVQPEIFDSKNSVGKRGSLHVIRDENAPAGYRVEIAFEVPEMGDMGGPHGHQARRPVPAEDLEQLLRTEHNGTYTYTQRQPGGPTRTVQ